MKQARKWLTGLCILSLTSSMVMVSGMNSAFADSRRDRDRHDYRDRDSRHDRSSRHHRDRDYVIHRGHRYVIPDRRVRRYRDIVIYRPYGHWYPGYGRIHLDNDAFKWLAFTAITLKLLDNLNEQQQREHEAAQIRATTAPIGERIIWNDGNASGSVTAVREGTSTAGRYCREFVQQVTIGGRHEQAYGTACRRQDGSWEVISTGDSR
jgi:hypothetical protein